MDDLAPHLAALSAPDATARRTAAAALIRGGESGADLSPALPTLAVALADPELAVAKTAAWVVYLAAWQGRPLQAILPQLRAAAALPELCGNATIALTLDALNRAPATADAALARMDEQDAAVHFGVAYALPVVPMFHVKRELRARFADYELG